MWKMAVVEKDVLFWTQPSGEEGQTYHLSSKQGHPCVEQVLTQMGRQDLESRWRQWSPKAETPCLYGLYYDKHAV